MKIDVIDVPSCGYRTLLNGEGFKKIIIHHLLSYQGRDPERGSTRDVYKAVSYMLRDFLIARWIETQKHYYTKTSKRVYYLSMEFLVGRCLGNSLINLGLFNEIAAVLKEMGFDIETIREEEQDPALGNGGLGRLAACFMDSLATLGIPGHGCGIRYEYGLFFQRLIDGFQVEYPDNWLRYGTPWEYERQGHLYRVRFHGRVKHVIDSQGRFRAEWLDTEDVMAMPCDLLIPGFQNDTVVNMRLFTAKASRELDFGFFNKGDYIGAVQNKVRSETISKLLYPSDERREGQELRLKQQYFFVAATFQDILRRFKKRHADFEILPDTIAVQLNDTHPAIAIPELMRIMVDKEGVCWEKAWNICVRVFSYTNHTLMPEALEMWPVEMLGRVLPRHLEIIYEINRRFLDDVARAYPGDQNRLKRMSLIEEGEVKKVRMAYLAIVGSHTVNGVAVLHSHLMQTRIFNDFHLYYPGKFINITNGITQRRWLLKCNTGLADLITATIGDKWITDLDVLRQLSHHAHDEAFQERWREVKLHNKIRLARIIHGTCKVEVDPATLFDVQVKRIHEYKRQLLNVLHIIHLYHRLLAHPGADLPARTVIFSGKTAPSYWRAKLIIKLINSVAEVVNADHRIGGRLKVVFIPNYDVSLAEKIIPAADLSEQISTAGTEASGTGNMKLGLNGALTIGTLDGANIEIREEVGPENIFIFGMTAQEAEAERYNPRQLPREIYHADEGVQRTIDAIGEGAFSRGDRDLFQPLVESLLSPRDPYMLLYDFKDYLHCQDEVGRVFQNVPAWTAKSILNVARMGKFSSDRAVREYAEKIWHIPVTP